MRDLQLGTIMKAALIAGVVAGLAAAAFHFLATEPLIDRAIMLETLRHQAAGTVEEPMVSRDMQRVGLFVGFLIFGLTWSLLFGATYHLSQRWLPAWSTRNRGLLVAAAGYWSVALLPFLKYPSNPPGVGDPETITFRQTLYLAVLGLSVLGTVLGLAVAWSRGGRVGLVFLAIFTIVVYVALPANPDVISTSADILVTFRALSIAGLTLFWAVLGLTFGLLAQRQTADRTLRQSVGIA
jgi:predicted cobalt transporter CbtA